MKSFEHHFKNVVLEDFDLPSEEYPEAAGNALSTLKHILWAVEKGFITIEEGIEREITNAIKESIKKLETASFYGTNENTVTEMAKRKKKVKADNIPDQIEIMKSVRKPPVRKTDVIGKSKKQKNREDRKKSKQDLRYY